MGVTVYVVILNIVLLFATSCITGSSGALSKTQQDCCRVDHCIYSPSDDSDCDDQHRKTIDGMMYCCPGYKQVSCAAKTLKCQICEQKRYMDVFNLCPDCIECKECAFDKTKEPCTNKTDTICEDTTPTAAPICLTTAAPPTSDQPTSIPEETTTDPLTTVDTNLPSPHSAGKQVFRLELGLGLFLAVSILLNVLLSLYCVYLRRGKTPHVHRPQPQPGSPNAAQQPANPDQHDLDHRDRPGSSNMSNAGQSSYDNDPPNNGRPEEAEVFMPQETSQ